MTHWLPGGTPGPAFAILHYQFSILHSASGPSGKTRILTLPFSSVDSGVPSSAGRRHSF